MIKIKQTVWHNMYYHILQCIQQNSSHIQVINFNISIPFNLTQVGKARFPRSKLNSSTCPLIHIPKWGRRVSHNPSFTALLVHLTKHIASNRHIAHAFQNTTTNITVTKTFLTQHRSYPNENSKKN